MFSYRIGEHRQSKQTNIEQNPVLNFATLIDYFYRFWSRAVGSNGSFEGFAGDLIAEASPWPSLL